MELRQTHAPNRREANAVHTAPQPLHAAPKPIDSHYWKFAAPLPAADGVLAEKSGSCSIRHCHHVMVLLSADC